MKNAPPSLEITEETEADEIARFLGGLEFPDDTDEAERVVPGLNERDVEAIIAAIEA